MTVEERLDAIEAVLSAAAEPPSGPEYSFPVANEAMSESQWQQVATTMGTGIIDRGGRPYDLTGFDNATNTAKLRVSTTTKTAEAILEGFFHRLTEDMTLSFPAVRATTTYRVVIEFTPLEAEREDGGPCKVKVVAGELPTSQGRKYIELAQVRREADQLLTEAQVTIVRPRVAPTLTFESVDALRAFNIASTLYGAQAVIVGGDMVGAIYTATGDETAGPPSRWVSVTSPAWQPLSLAGGMETRSAARAEYRIHQGHVELRGVIIRGNGNSFPTSQYARIAAVPGVIELATPWNSASATAQNGRSALIEPGANGTASNVIWAVVSGTTTWVHLDGAKLRLKTPEAHSIP